MRIAVIGAAGFVGKTLCRLCVERGHEVIGYDLSGAIDAGDGATRPLDVIADDIEFAPETDSVIYLAQSPFYREFPDRGDHLFGVNVQGAIKAATAACKGGVKFFCYASTGNVYQPSLDALKESSPLRRDDPYALSKVMAEDALRLFGSRMSVLCVRIFGAFGPDQKTMLPVRLMEMIQSGQPITLAGTAEEGDNPEGLRISLCYVDDVAACIIGLAELARNGNSLPPALNVGGPEPISIRRFAQTAGRLMGVEPTFQVADGHREFDLVADITQLENLIELNFTDFDKAMSATVGH